MRGEALRYFSCFEYFFLPLKWYKRKLDRFPLMLFWVFVTIGIQYFYSTLHDAGFPFWIVLFVIIFNGLPIFFLRLKKKIGGGVGNSVDFDSYYHLTMICLSVMFVAQCVAVFVLRFGDSFLVMAALSLFSVIFPFTFRFEIRRGLGSHTRFKKAGDTGWKKLKK